MSNTLATINLVVHNGEKYIRRCLDSVLAQSYPHELIELNILDNTSTDSTAKIIEDLGFRPCVARGYAGGVSSDFGFAKFTFEKSKVNLGMWPGQELLLEHSAGKYIVALSVDVILHPDFIKNAVEIMEQSETIGALQAKVYKYEMADPGNNPICSHRKTLGSCDDAEILDTCGFKIFKSRRIVNIGHGEEDMGQYDGSEIRNSKFEIRNSAKICYKQIFAVEGAVSVFHRKALEDCRLISQNYGSPTSILWKSDFHSIDNSPGKIIDPDFFWYGDDLDLAWRMRLFGWEQVYTPSVIAWHDRKTTKSLAGGSMGGFIKIRKTVPMFKRRLDWRNTTLAIIKNDFASNWLRDLPYILWRQLRLWAYFLIFETAMIPEVFQVAKMLPKMLKRRKEIMKKVKISPREFHKWMN